jgi:hypothetical protein
MARILPGFVWPTAQDIDQLLARSREPQDNRHRHQVNALACRHRANFITHMGYR